MLRHRPTYVPARLLACLLALALGGQPFACHGPPAAETAPAPARIAPADSAFARLVARLSEPGGYFDTDNLISNERSYLHVLGALHEHGVEGGAYLGVGPDQNFAYIARIRPRIAFIVDIRRDNLLQHVLFKALFARARNRLEYLCLLLGKPTPDDLDAWQDRPVEALAAYLDATPRRAADAARAAVQEATRSAGLPLSAADLAAIDRIHRRFIEEGLDLRFSSHGRTPNAYYPTFRQLLLETDLAGRPGSFLAHEDAFRFVQQMQARDLIVPVVGDLAGAHALAAIGRYLAERGEHVSAFYTSNIEFYLMRQGRFARFVENLRTLPIDGRSVIVRSYFNRWSADHPQTQPGYASTQLLQTVESLLEEYERGGYRSYRDLIHKHLIEVH